MRWAIIIAALAAVPAWAQSPLATQDGCIHVLSVTAASEPVPEDAIRARWDFYLSDAPAEVVEKAEPVIQAQIALSQAQAAFARAFNQLCASYPEQGLTGPLPALSERSPVVFERVDGLRVTVAVDPTYRFEVMGDIGRRESLPQVSMRRAEGDESSVEVEVSEAEAGLFWAYGQFTAPGGWTLLLDYGGEAHEFTFILRE